MAEESEKSSNKSKIYIFVFFGILLFVGGAISSGYFIKEQPQVLGLSAQSEVSSLIAKVEKLIVLPSNEIPTATTITDPKKLKDQFFFRNAKKGDKLLVYGNAQWAVLYRPSENKIIEAGAFTDRQAIPAVTPTPTVAPTPTSAPSPTPEASATPEISATPALTPAK